MIKLHEILEVTRKKHKRAKLNRELARQITKVQNINFNRRNRHNIGDLMSAPAEHVESLNDFKMIEIFRCQSRLKLENKNVIIGGGGLFSNDFFAKHLSHIIASNPKLLICWGAGQNTHDSQQISYPSILREFDLVGIRDYNGPYEWVPCASCLHKVFDRKYDITHEIVLYNHLEFSALNSFGFPEMNNSVTNMDEVIRFLGSGNTVLTTSYHGAYWATLLGRKVVVVNPFSSKFFAFRHPVTLANNDDWHLAIKQAISYPESLEECRERNREFTRKVQERIG